MYQEDRLQYNEEATLEKLKEPYYQSLKEWADKSGIIVNGAEWPAFYGPNGVLRGVRASRDIQPYEAIMAVPQSLLLMSIKARSDKEFQPIFDQFASFFDAKNHESFAEYHKLLFFMIRERQIPDNHSLKHTLEIISEKDVYGWANPETIKNIKDPVVRQELAYYFDLMEKTWVEAEPIFKASAHLYRTAVTKDEFRWAYFYLNSRCFGNGMPSLVYTPVIDLVNNAEEDNRLHSFVLHRGLEKLPDPECQAVRYKKQSREIHLTTVFPELNPNPVKTDDKQLSVQFVEAVSHVCVCLTQKVPHYRGLSARQGNDIAAQVGKELLHRASHVHIWDLPDWVGEYFEDDINPND